jgi:pSer/pThr/pTyr-binding forkhead associated (FHA) protein
VLVAAHVAGDTPAVVEHLDLASAPFLVFGRNPECSHLVLAHPTISRQHAVIQHGKNDGEMYICDLGSTHGTAVNMEKLRPNVFVRIYVGDIILFGKSSRFYVIDGPNNYRSPDPISKMIARELNTTINARYPGRETWIDVSEDGENGCFLKFIN